MIYIINCCSFLYVLYSIDNIIEIKINSVKISTVFFFKTKYKTKRENKLLLV